MEKWNLIVDVDVMVDMKMGRIRFRTDSTMA